MRPPRFIFDHLPKTAGTSLLQVFTSLLGAPAVRHLPNGTSARQAEKTLQGPVRLSGGHLAFPPGHRPPPGVGYITFLRHPVERALSLYFHARQQPDASPGTYVAWAQQLDLETFCTSAEPCVQQVIADFYTRHFSAAHGVAVAAPESALQRLSSYAFVGVVEELEDALALLCVQAGWQLPMEIPRCNIAPREEVSPRVWAKLEARNAADLEVYDRVRQNFVAHRRDFLRRAAAHRNIPEENTTAAAPVSSEPATPAAVAPVQFGSQEVAVTHVELLRDDRPASRFASGEVLRVRLTLFSSIEERELTVGLAIRDAEQRTVFGTNLALLRHAFSVEPHGVYRCEFKVGLRLQAGNYTLGLAVHAGLEHSQRCYDWREAAAHFTVAGFATLPFDGLVDLPCIASTHLDRIHRPLKNFAGDIRRGPGDSTFTVLVWNHGEDTWPHRPPHPVRVGCRWLDAEGLNLPLEGARSDLPHPVQPDGHATVTLDVGPPPPGAACCRVTLVQEGVAWFDLMDGPFIDTPVSPIIERIPASCAP